MIKTDKNQDIISCFNVLSGDESRNVDGKANAAFIVKACNSHQKLLDALKYVCALFPEDMSDDNSGRIGFSRKSEITINEAREAIKEAE